MTERLTTLLRREADGLPVPLPDTDQIIGAGRRQRRGHTAASALTAAALVAVAAVGGGVLLGGDRGDGSGRQRSDLPAASSSQLQGWAVASGSTVQLGTGRTTHVDGKVKSLYYTSAGVVVRHGAKAATDAPDSAYALVDRRGDVSDLDLELGDRVPGTDPSEPYLVYAQPTKRADRWDVVVRDVRTGAVARTVRVSGAFTWGGWVAPPVALSGEHAYVALDSATVDVDVATGEQTTSTALHPSSFPDVAGERAVVKDRRGVQRIVDVRTGRPLLSMRNDEQLLGLSPDGRYALRYSYRTCDDADRCVFDDPTGVVYDLSTSKHAEVDLSAAGYGWTPQGELLRVTDDAVDVCDPLTAACRSTPIEVGGDHLRLGGTSYES